MKIDGQNFSQLPYSLSQCLLYLFQNFLDRETFNCFLGVIDGDSIFKQFIEYVKFFTAIFTKQLKRMYDMMICTKDAKEDIQEENVKEPNRIL